MKKSSAPLHEAEAKTKAKTLIATLWKHPPPSLSHSDSQPLPSKASAALRAVVLVLSGVAFTGLLSHLKIPLWPVPITGQSLAVLLIGLTYGSRLALLTMLTYLLGGGLGLPFFAGGIGWGVFIGPTAGYLFAFPLTAYLLGWMAEKGYTQKALPTFGCAFLGTLLIYLLGLLWLARFMGFNLKLFQAGMFPFLIGDFLKVVFVMTVLPTTWRIVRKVVHKTT